METREMKAVPKSSVASHWGTTFCVLIGALFAQSTQASTLEAINHTHWAINQFSVNGRSGLDTIGPYQGGGGGCCYIAPKRWHHGMTVRVDWETGTGSSAGFPGFADEAKYFAWVDKIEAQKRRHSKEVAIPDYTGQKVCGLTVHFLPCDELQVTTSCYAYLRTIPSLSIVEFQVELAQIRRSELIAAGQEVLSQPIGPQRTVCRYTTTQDLRLQPIELQSLRLAHEPDGRSLLRLRFACATAIDWSQIDLSRVPMYLNADAPLASALHQALTLNAEALYVRLPGEAQRVALAGHFAPKGFADEDRLWPKGDSAFSGYQLLLEYFTFREKFMFVTLHGLEQVNITADMPWFELEVVLRESWPHLFNQLTLILQPTGKCLRWNENHSQRIPG